MANSGRCLVLPGRRECSATPQKAPRSSLSKTRISNAIFNNEIPDPRDVIIITVSSTRVTCFASCFQLDDESEQRIHFICKMDLIGRSIAAAVSHNLAGPLLRRSALTKKFRLSPSVSCCLIHTFAKTTYPLSLPTLQKSMARCFRSALPLPNP